MKAKRLKVVVLYSNGHLGSIIVLNRLMKMKAVEVVGILPANNLELSEKGLKKMSRQIKKTGILFAFMLFFQRFIQALAFASTSLFPFLKRRLRTCSEIAEEHNIPVMNTKNVNSIESLEFLRQLQPDLGVSAYFPHILKARALSIPRLGILNIHPGWLPEYKGAMSYFWCLRNNESKAGVSVHWMDEGIDTGPLLARRRFKIRRKNGVR